MWGIPHIQPLKTELTECSETSAYYNFNQTLGKYPKEYIHLKYWIFPATSNTAKSCTYALTFLLCPSRRGSILLEKSSEEQSRMLRFVALHTYTACASQGPSAQCPLRKRNGQRRHASHIPVPAEHCQSQHTQLVCRHPSGVQHFPWPPTVCIPAERFVMLDGFLRS